MLMNCQKSQLLVVDVQEKLVPAMTNADKMLLNVEKLLKSAELLEVPCVISEQYPRGLGPTISQVITQAGNATTCDKMHFSCAKNPAISKIVQGNNRNQVIVCGMEAHVCVLQSAISFKESGYDVFVVADACTSRKQTSVDIAFQRMQGLGLQIVSTEMVLFEWLEVAGNDDFKQISSLIK